MANKQYISPIRLFEHCSVPYKEEINIPRIKKQLIAEFDFAATGFIEIDNYTYNKNDVLNEIENPDFTNRLHYHERIWQNKNILNLLESNTVNIYGIKGDFSSFAGDEKFDTFFSPYFAAPFNHISRNFLTNRKLEEEATLLLFEDFILPPEREEAFKAIRIFIEENLRFFRNTSTENYGTFRPKLQHWVNADWHDFLNNLPDDFHSAKIDLAVDLINLSVKIQKTNRSDCRSISRNLVELDYLPANLWDTVTNNDKIYNNRGVRRNDYRWIIWVIFILIKLLSMGGCN